MSRHMVRGRQLSRDTEHRKALRRNMVQSLFEHGKVRTDALGEVAGRHDVDVSDEQDAPPAGAAVFSGVGRIRRGRQ